MNWSTTGKVYKHYWETDLVKNRSRSGQPKIFTGLIQKLYLKKRRGTSHKICNEFHESVSVEVSEKTIQQQLHELGYQAYCHQKKLGIKEIINNRKSIFSTAEAKSNGLSMVTGKGWYLAPKNDHSDQHNGCIYKGVKKTVWKMNKSMFRYPPCWSKKHSQTDGLGMYGVCSRKYEQC